ncbi:MAG: hypothetical protein ACHRHE_18865 [Tepidisphaerales bacterium]
MSSPPDEKPTVLDYQSPTAPPGGASGSQLVGLGVLHFVASAVSLVFTLLLLVLSIRVAGMHMYEPRDIETMITVICFALTAAMAGLTWLYCCMGIWLCRQLRLKACRIGAAITVIVIPFGSILSVWTMIALHRPGVATLFDRSEAGAI